MKTFFRIFIVFILLVILALIAIPLVFKKELMQKAREEINKNVKARVEWTDFSVSLLKGFPDLKITLDDLSVTGIDQFEGDTLVAFDRFMVNIDLLSIFSDKIRVKSVILQKPVMRAIILADGSVNWDITYPSDELIEEAPADTSVMEMTISLKKFEVKDGSVSYIDKELDMSAWLEGFNFSLTGDLSEAFSELTVTSFTNAFTFDYEGFKYINKASMHFDALIAADLLKYEFTFSDNYIKLNDLILGLEGMFGMPNDEDIVVDLKFFAKETSFKSILSMVPAVYMQDFGGLKTSGTMTLEGTAKGLYNEKEMPSINLALLVKDGYFAYPDLPKAVEKVNLDFKMFYDGVYEDNTTININRFSMEAGGNPVDMRFNLITPMSDMQMTGAIKGSFNLASLAEFYPVDDMDLSGLINLDLELMGKLSDIENENFEAFKADGLLEVMDIEVSGGDIPMPVQISRLSMLFSPRYVNLNHFEAKIGSSDMQINGRLENFIPYVFSDGIIKGQLNLTSSLMNLNEMLTDTEEEETVVDTVYVLSVIEIPENIDFVFTTYIGKVLYDKLDISGLNGKITAREGKLIMDKLYMDLLEGNMIMSGEYNTTDIRNPMVDFNFKMNNIDIPSAFYAFNTVEKLAPIAENCIGNISVDLSFTSLLDSTMYPVMSGITGKGRVRSDNVEISENDVFDKMSQLLKNNRLKNPQFKDLNLSFEIRNGRVFVDPFDTKIASMDLNIGGDQGIDQTLNYFINMSIPRNEFGASANDVLENLLAQASAKGFDVKAGDRINTQFRIKGSFSDPEISMDVKENLQKAKAEIKEAVQERVQEEVQKIKEEVTEEVRERVSEEVDKIMLQAEEEAERIRRTANEAGERLIGEAQLQGRNLIKEAGTNPLKRVAAERTAAELEKKARQQADKLNTEADQKAEKLLEDARARADALKDK